MNSFNSIEKIKFEKNKDDIVNLNEYILFDDEENKEKYVILKLRNNLNQALSEIRLEIKQYNETEELVEKVIVEYNDLSVSGLEEFVPEAKIKLNYLCKTISSKLLYAKFKEVYWENDQFIKIAYTFNEYKDSKFEKPKQEKIVNKKAIKAKNKKKAKFTRVDVTKKNFTVFPHVYRIFILLVFIAGLITLSMVFRNSSDEFSDGTFSYRILDNKKLAVVDIDNVSDNLNIPQEVFGYTVAKIEDSAFENSNVKNINIEGHNVIIGENAFKNSKIESVTGGANIVSKNAFFGCENLNNVNLPEASLIKRYAFYECVDLKELIVKNASIEEYALMGAISLVNMEYSQTSCYSFGNLFGTSNKDVPETLKIITTHQLLIKKPFFDNIFSLEYIYIESNSDCMYTYTVFDRYDINGMVKIRRIN